MTAPRQRAARPFEQIVAEHGALAKGGGWHGTPWQASFERNIMPTCKQIIDRVAQGLAGSSAGFDTDGRLHGRLATLAERQGLRDVSYRTIDSPLGPLLLAATGKGLVRVAFSREDHESVLSRLATDISPRILRTPRRLDKAARQLEEYFAGKRRAFTVPVDLQLAHGFRRPVLLHLL